MIQAWYGKQYEIGTLRPRRHYVLFECVTLFIVGTLEFPVGLLGSAEGHDIENNNLVDVCSQVIQLRDDKALRIDIQRLVMYFDGRLLDGRDLGITGPRLGATLCDNNG